MVVVVVVVVGQRICRSVPVSRLATVARLLTRTTILAKVETIAFAAVAVAVQ